ncbi:MAG: asparagine synthase-related protein [Pseudomonadota bacterium]
MSDFIFSSNTFPQGELTKFLATIYLNKHVGSSEFHGSWGSLSVTSSRYNGFQPLETERYICVVIGGPVLYFQDNTFLGKSDAHAGTRAILDHWSSGNADWSEDLSGPFVILVIDKPESRVECITDLMMFIPVYQCLGVGSIFWGTHIDALAQACEKQDDFDEVSLVDFVLHHAVTYPYTAYEKIYQCQPASVHRWIHHQNNSDNAPELKNPEAYWRPLEHNPYSNLDEAARTLRDGVQGYIDRITSPLQHVAQFISAGEDSRALAGMLPQRLKRDAYIFLDFMNREGRIAKKVAHAYEIRFKPDYRSKNHYLDILPEASSLLGSGHQYLHAHTLKFDDKNCLTSYGAVFGGYISDSLLKAYYAKKSKWFKRFPFLPQIAGKGEIRTTPVSHSLFPDYMLEKITQRRREHYIRVKELRPKSAHEWFELWPATMRITIPNLYANRRLFASYEVFMAKESVKVAANVPVSWKLNRRLFNTAFKSALKKSRHIFHADGRLPYYSWWVNSPIQFSVWFYRLLARRTGLKKSNEGPWNDWHHVMASEQWSDDVAKYTNGNILPEFENVIQSNALFSGGLSTLSKINILQVLYQVKKSRSTCHHRNVV